MTKDWRDATKNQPPRNVPIRLRWADGTQCDGRHDGAEWIVQDCQKMVAPDYWLFDGGASRFFFVGMMADYNILIAIVMGLIAALIIFAGYISIGLILVAVIVLFFLHGGLVNLVQESIKLHVGGATGSLLGKLIAFPILIAPAIILLLIAIYFYRMYQ